MDDWDTAQDNQFNMPFYVHLGIIHKSEGMIVTLPGTLNSVTFNSHLGSYITQLRGDQNTALLPGIFNST